MSIMSKLYIIATPIGNLEDITLRAIRVLGEVEKVFAEDTRVTRKLFDKYDIKTPLESLNARTEKGKAERVLELLGEGKDLALVSDAGTPGISDPGSMLVKFVRENSPETEIISVPGASSLTAALSVAGESSSDFVFFGFLPHKKGRETLFKEIAESTRTAVLFESPHRIMKTLASLGKHLEPGRKIVVAREMTKIHEEVVSGTPLELTEYFNVHPEKVRGEFVLIVSRA
jgi:16S rRNA (cytidine1402-2'-O)-methyltransferase